MTLLGLGPHTFLSLSTSAMSLLYECVNTVIAGECADHSPARRVLVWVGDQPPSRAASMLGEDAGAFLLEGAERPELSRTQSISWMRWLAPAQVLFSGAAVNSGFCRAHPSALPQAPL